MRPATRCLTLLAALSGLFVVALPAAGAPTYTITTTVVGSGTIALDPQKAGYQKNNIVIVTAAPDAGWTFDHWEGSLAGTQNPATLRVGGNSSITGVFLDTSAPPPGADRPPLPGSKMVVGYFTQWSIYRRGYLLRDVQKSGAAAELDVINYAFAAPDEALRCASLDTFADYGKRFEASESVDGVADTVSQPLKGNFNQLRKLKAKHPGLRALISLGGWTQSARFSDAALPENRTAFVASCIDMFMRGNVAPGVSAAGVFDGIDVDWEYPGSCGATCSSRPSEDVVNFTALLAEFRRQLDAYEVEAQGSSTTRPEFLLTIAAPAGAAHYDPIDLKAIAVSLDWINVMAYDFHGSWETAGPANHQAPLYQSPCDDGSADWAEKAMKAYLVDVPPSKLLLGVPFYGRGWRTAAVGDGLCETANGIPRGTYEKGVNDFKVLDAQGRPDFYGEGTHWTFNGSEFWSYDDPTSIAVKAGYVNGTPVLRGMMFWELSGDTADAKLLKALRGSLGREPATR